MNALAIGAYRALDFLQGPSRREFWFLEQLKARIQDWLSNRGIEL